MTCPGWSHKRCRLMVSRIWEKGISKKGMNITWSRFEKISVKTALFIAMTC